MTQWTHQSSTVTSSEGAILAVGQRPNKTPAQMIITNTAAPVVYITLNNTAASATNGKSLPQYASLVLEGADDMLADWAEMRAFTASSARLDVLWKGGK